MTGYLHPGYAESLAEFGTPRALARSGGWIIERPIAQTAHRDAMGCYPIFACQDWSQLGADLVELERRIVSLALVADPFSGYDGADLSRIFDVVKHFKDHYLVELSAAPAITQHHRYYARRALRDARVEYCATPLDYLDEWIGFYQNLIARHDLQGIKAFSRSAFARQLALPGLVMLRVVRGDAPVGAHLWYLQNGVAHSHLMAMNDIGYGMSAAYALYSSAIEIFRERFPQQAHILDLGAGAGVGANAADGLSQFKKGWSNAIRPVYFCGRIFDPDAYAALSGRYLTSETAYFPAYRSGELA